MRAHIATIVLTLFMACSSLGAERVLVLHSYHKGEWTDEVCRGIRSQLASSPAFDPSIEYMDTKRIHSPDYLRGLVHLYQLKYADTRFDVIITVDNNALDFALAHHQSLFHMSPIVFCGVNGFSRDLLHGDPWVTGVVEEGEFEETLRTALALCPGTTRLLVIGDSTRTSQINEAALQEVVAREFPALDVEPLGHLMLPELVARLGSASPDALPFFISYWQQPDGTPVAPHQLETALRASARPVFGRSEWLINHGLAGGKCVRGVNQGSRAGELAKAILEGVAVTNLPIDQESPNTFLFDYSELSEHGVDISALPDDALIFNQPARFYQVPKQVLSLLIALLATLSVGVAGLWLSRIRRRRAEQLLRASEQRFRDLVETTSDIIWETDANGCFSYVSPTATKILGYTSDAFIGKLPTEFLTESTRHDIVHAFGSPDDPRSFSDIDCTAVHKDGPHVHVAVSGLPIRDGAGKLIGFRGITRDVTRSREAEAMRRMTQFVVDHAVDAIIWVDHSGRVTYSNKAACAWFGYSHEEFQGMGFHEIDPAYTSAIWTAEWERLKDIPSDTFETHYHDREGHDVPVEVVASYVAYEGRARICLAIRNISERRNFEEQLRQSQKMESVGMLAGGIAHDFNNMLGGITGAAELLRSDLKDQPEAEKHLQLILQAADAAAQMTQQLLAFSRKGSVVYKPFDLHTVLHAALSILSHSIDRRIEIHTHPEAERTIIKGDAALLQNAILNLCINARDAMPDGGELTLTTRNITLNEMECTTTAFPLKPGEFIQLTIADTGVGMDTHTAEKIFEPFFSTKQSGFGTGLGLSAVYGTVQDLRGSIDVVTAPDKGTVFTMYLPLAGSIGAHEVTSRLQKPVTESEKPSGGGCVLVVDDEQAIRDVLSSALTRAGYEVLLACDGKDAIELFEQASERIDVVLLDMLMPRMNGQECFKQLRKIDPTVSVVVQSGFSFEHEMDAMFAQGIRAFLRKPYKLSEIVDAVRQAALPPSQLP